MLTRLRPAHSEYKTFLRDFWDTQTQTFENRGQGWIFWTWKAAVSHTPVRWQKRTHVDLCPFALQPAEWSYQAGLSYGWIPRNPSEHRGYKCS